MHHRRAVGGQLQHLLVADLRPLPRLGHQARVGRVDPLDVRIDLRPLRLQRGGERDRRRVRRPAPERRDLHLLADPLEAGDDDRPARFELVLNALRVHLQDARAAVALVGADARLGARERDRRMTGVLERHRQQRRRDDLAGR